MPTVPGPSAARHPLFARVQALCASLSEHMEEPFRREAFDGLAGEVLEVGAGSGLSFANYPPTVTGVVALEPEPYLRARAERAAAAAPVPVRVVDGVAERLPFADASFDAATVLTVLCSVRDQPAALGEIRRVLRPGGELRFFEHVRAQDAGLLDRQRRLDRWLWPLVAGGCHCARDTEAAIVAAGLQVLRCRRFSLDTGPLFAHVSPMIVGAARRP